MKLLILGGTVFLGRHLVQAALSRGHTVTLFNRGQHNPELFPQVARLRGDRGGALTALRGQAWDAALDTCGYVPRVVRASASALAGSVRHYTFVSSLSVYARLTDPGVTEAAPLATIADETTEEVTGETYGALKALCERAAEQALPGRALVVRPGLIVGPHDPSDRFTYWPHRMARGGRVLAPGRQERKIQFIDARDLAAWVVRMVEGQQTGIFNATGIGRPLAMGEFLETCQRVCASEGSLEWVSEKFLTEQGVQPYTQLPLWIPGADDGVDCTKAITAGLVFRPLETTIRETLLWDIARPAGTVLRSGLSADHEIELLRAWFTRELG